MKNYLKVVVGSKNIEVFTFEDTDEVATKEALSSAESLSRRMGAKVVVWALTGRMPKSLRVVGEVYEHGESAPRNAWVPESDR